MPSPSRHLPVLAAISMVFTAPAFAGDWWNPDWAQRKPITINTAADGATVGDPVGSAPVLVRLHQGNFQFGAAKEDGSDIRFVSEDNKTVLSYQVERIDPLLNEAFLWVKVPEIKAGGSTKIWLYFDNQKAEPLAADLAKATLDTDFVGVYRFAAAGSPPADASAANNTALNPGTGAEGAMIGGGLRLDGKAAVELPDSPSLAWNQGGAMTISLWVKPGALAPNAAILSRRDGSSSFVLGLDNGIPFVSLGGQRAAATAALTAGYWRHVAVTAGAGRVTLYVDGEQAATVDAGLPAMKGSLRIGDADGSGFVGEIDQLEISRVARTAGFVKFAAFSQSGDKGEKMMSSGENEEPSNMFSWLTKGHFGVIIKNLTFDGWIVIIILAVMAVISWWVMIGKNNYLGAVTKANNVFMKEWQKIATNMTQLDEEESREVERVSGEGDKKMERNLRNSPLFRVYHIGVEEIQQRFAGKGGTAARRLSASSIPAIRASLDGGLVRETQRLNSMMVLLTIAISGGPFLGLLGTVVGVMITFAAIAEAGDVNVNSIAPGIAAALLATVAGLAVAIPSLFGYNWLLTRIKSVTSDMHVFIDEFITRMAEMYCERDNPNA